MIHLPQLISDLGLILATAGATTLLFKKIKQPIVLGYILAGLLVGPHFSLVPTVVDEKGIQTWSEIGVIFLLFSLGLEFSFKKLVKVGGSASITAIVEVVLMLVFGFFTGQLLGWSVMDSIFLGGILSVSSTTIIIRAFEEIGVKSQKFAGLVFGVLIVEDLVAILLLVLLTTLAVSQQFAGTEMLMQLLKLCFFLVLWFLGGIFIIPTFLKKAKKLMNDETLLIVSLALCLLMVLLAAKSGFSAALGAFIMGSLLAETTQAERIEHLTKSVKDLFAAIFFVSVGMLIDPAILVEHAVPVLVITLVTIFGKFLSSGLGALLSAQPLKTSVQAGMSLAQIGEFSFIIATLGLSLKVTSDFLYPIAVAVSAITTFTTPYLIRLSGPFYSFLERTLPQKLLVSINRYSSGTQQITAMSDWKVLLKSYVMNIIIHSVMLIAIVFLSSRYIRPLFTDELVRDSRSAFFIVIITLLFMAPFFWALAIRRIQKKAYSHLWLNKKVNRAPLIVLELSRIIIAILPVIFLLNLYLSKSIAIIITLAAIITGLVLFSRKLQAFYNRIEKRFLSNLNERENAETKHTDIVPWDAHLVRFEVSPQSPLIGKTLMESGIREEFGVNIALIERGKAIIATPGRDERLYPGDKLAVIGTDDQLDQLKDLIEYVSDDSNESDLEKQNLVLQKFVVTKSSPLLAHTIRESGLREKANALVVGIERNSTRMLNPDSTTQFQYGDIVWIVGNQKRLQGFLLVNNK